MKIVNLLTPFLLMESLGYAVTVTVISYLVTVIAYLLVTKN